jgi:flagellar basal-body rod modification protein FlgD
LSTTDGINGTSGASASSGKTENASSRASSLGRDAFLQLLVAQMSHQNPLQPQTDGEFIAQLAQFSSLEQLTTMNTTLARMAKAMGVVPGESE